MHSFEHRNPSRLIGMGQAPSAEVAASVLQCGFTQIPVCEYVTWTIELPQLDSVIQETFGDEIDILQSPKQVNGVTSVDSSFVLNGVLQTDMLAVGFGPHVFAEPQSFSQIGNVLTPAPSSSTATVVSPDVFTANDVAALGIPSGGTLLPGILEWGRADWEAGWHLANAYQFQWIMQQRYQVIKELLSDVAYFGPFADAVAAGTSEVDVQEYARQVNNRYRALAGTNTGIFTPINARRIGSVSDADGQITGNRGVFHPTRDFDLAPVTHGGLRNQGASGCQPFRKLPKPVLVEKGIPVGMSLFVQDAYHQAQMQRYMSISESQGGNLATVKLDANDSGASVISATDGIYELTLDQGPNQFAFQSVTTTRTIMKGGCLKLAILIKGFEVWGPWKEYLLTQLSQYIAAPSAALPGMR